MRIRQARDNLWASGSVDLDVDAVARFVRGVGAANAPLVLLSEHGCGVLRTTGTGAITVHTADGGLGYIAIDSDGSDCSNPNKVVLDVNGQGSVTADKVYMWALADGDATSAYSSGLISPTPVASSARVSRSGDGLALQLQGGQRLPGLPDGLHRRDGRGVGRHRRTAAPRVVHALDHVRQELLTERRHRGPGGQLVDRLWHVRAVHQRDDHLPGR